jgi:UDP-2,3-diacylglucosamine hydrolase
VTTLFISDLHLSPERPQFIHLFRVFLQQEAQQAEALYILGDLFDVWLGDDAIAADIQPIVDDLLALTQSGVPVFIMVGNRDFLLDEHFSKLTGCQYLADPSVINLYGEDVLLMHGDTLCTDDLDYQQFRQLVRNPAWQKDFLAKSIEERIQIGRAARAQSKTRTQQKADEIMDVNAMAVDQAFRQHHVKRLIHGHTHRPAVHQLCVNDDNVQRIVLGDWYERSSILRVTKNAIELCDARI